MIKRFNVYILILILSIFFIKTVFGSEIKIIFKINEKAFTSLDYETRVKYLDFVGSNNQLDKNIILNDYISSSIFFEYYKNSNDGNDYYTKATEIYENILKINKQNNKKYIYEINKEDVIFNIKIDFIRKTILENILNSNINNINRSNEEIDLLYNLKIKYINFENKNIEILNNINNLTNAQFEDVLELLKNSNINFFIKEEEINNINKIDKRIKKNILLNNDSFTIIKNNKISIIFLEKKLSTFDGIIASLFSIKSIDQLSKNDLKCQNISNNIKNLNIISKDYNFIDLNNELKENLININDYIKFTTDNENIYVVLCDIK